MKNKDATAAESTDPNSNTDSEHADTEGCNFGLNPIELPYLWYPNQQSVNHLEYVRRLECEFTCLQRAFLALTTQFARLQFRVRQIVQAHPCEREALLLDLEHMAFNAEDNDELPPIQRDAVNMGDVRRKQSFIIERLREQLCTLAEAQSWTPIPDLDAEPPAPDSVDEVTCFCIKKKRKPPPTPTGAPSTEDASGAGAAMSSAESTHSATSKSKAETTGMESESPSEYNKSKSNLKQRVSIGEEALGMGRNPDAAFSVTTSTVCFELCQEKVTSTAAAASSAAARKPPRTCECKTMKRRQNSSNNNCEPKC